MWNGLRVGIFIDSANIHAGASEIFNKRVDYKEILKLASQNYHLQVYRAVVYAVKHGESFINWETALRHMGFEIKSKEPKRYPDGSSKADWDIELAVDVIKMLDCIDVVAIVSGDGDFIPLVKHCQSKGKLVKVIGVSRTTSKDLIGIADEFISIDMEHLRESVKRSPPSPIPAGPNFGDGLSSDNS